MSRLKSFSVVNPTGDTPGMEPVRLDVLRAAVANTPTEQTEPAEAPVPAPTPAPTATAQTSALNAPATVATPQPPPLPLVNKNIRLPADLVDFVDFVYTKDRRLKKQDAYTEALEAYFRPLMKK